MPWLDLVQVTLIYLHYVPTCSKPATTPQARSARDPPRPSVFFTLQSHTRTCTTRNRPSYRNLCTTPASTAHSRDSSRHRPPSDRRVCTNFCLVCASRDTAPPSNSYTLPRGSAIYRRHKPVHCTYPQWVQAELLVERDVPTREEFGGKCGICHAARETCAGSRERYPNLGEGVSRQIHFIWGDRSAGNGQNVGCRFQECAKYMSSEQISNFLNAAIRNRIAVRLIAEQHIVLSRALQDPEQANTNIGVVNMSLSPVEMIRMCASFVSELCEATLGAAPPVVIDGVTDATFA